MSLIMILYKLYAILPTKLNTHIAEFKSNFATSALANGAGGSNKQQYSGT